MGTQVNGRVNDGFEEVRDEFERNLTERGDVGASVAVFVEGDLVVDLWGGARDEAGTPWAEDTLACTYSVGKGFMALAAHMLVEAGELALDRPVAEYWPEFAALGKEGIRVEHVLAHEAGLIAPRGRHGMDVMYDWDAACALLADTAPWWEPGTRQGYHVYTYGYLVGELIRRITGSMPGEFLRKQIAEPLGADVHLGTPATEHDRVAQIISQPSFTGILDLLPGLPKEPIEAIDQHPFAPTIAGFTHMELGDHNSAAFREAEIPASNLHATAKGLACIYDAMVSRDFIGEATLRRAVEARPMPGEQDVVLSPMSGFGPAKHRWGLGFQIDHGRLLDVTKGAFGHGGVSGALAFGDLRANVAFGYVPNTFVSGLGEDANRTGSLVAAVYRAIGALDPAPARTA